MKWKSLISVLAMQIFLGVTVQAQTVHLSVSASMTDVFRQLMTDFSAKRQDIQFLPSFASSGSLAKQIEQGAPADIYVSANPRWMKYLLEQQMIAPASDTILAYNRLVFVGMKKPNNLTLAGLTGLSRIALGSPQSVPAGQYARQALEHVGIYGVLEKDKKLVMAKDVRQALIYADRGEVDGAFVYKTDALLAKEAQILFTVDENLHDRVAYPVALTTAGAANDSARAFYDYIKGAEAKAVLRRYGFEPSH